MKKILFPTDFSECANHAFIYALELADHIGAEILALHVYQLPDLKRLKKLPSTISEVYDDIEFEEFENFRDSIPVLRKIAEENNFSHVKFSHLLLKGEADKTVVRTAKKEGADFIIMGTKGATGMKELFMGSVTSHVIHASDKIVISVSDKSDFDGVIDNVVYLTRLLDDEDNGLIQLKEFANQFEDCKITCLLMDTKGEGEQRLKKWSDSLDIDRSNLTFRSIPTNNIEKSLEDYCLSNEVDIVAMMPKKRTFWQKLFGKSLNISIALHSKIPLMTLPH